VLARQVNDRFGEPPAVDVVVAVAVLRAGGLQADVSPEEEELLLNGWGEEEKEEEEEGSPDVATESSETKKNRRRPEETFRARRTRARAGAHCVCL